MLHKSKRIILVFLAFLMLFQTFQPGLDALASERRRRERDREPMPIEGVETDAEDILWPEYPAEDSIWPDELGLDLGLSDDPEEEEESTELTGEDVVGELVHLRESNVKHFRMSDGSIIAVMYDTDVHFQDEDGEWVDIDNSLRLDTADDAPAPAAIEELLETIEERLEQAEDVDAEELQEILADVDIGVEDIVFATEDSLLDIHFNLESGCDYTPDFVLEHEGYSVGLSLIGAEEQLAEIVPMEPNPEDNSIAAAVQLPNLTNRIIYRDVLPGVDLEYVIHGHDIKENIIVNHLLDSHTFFFELDLGDLRPVHNEDGSILLVSRATDEEMFLIPAPFMWDANDEFSTAVRYELVPAGRFYGDSELDAAYFPEIADWDYENAQEDGRYLFVVIVDEDWMRDAERAFPVTIDPPIFTIWNRTSSNEGNISTGFIRSGQPNAASATGVDLFFGYSGGTGNHGWQIMYLRVNTLPTLPRNSIMVQAEIHLAQVGYSSVGKPNMRIPVYAVTSEENNPSGEWLNSTTWNNNRPSHSNIMLDYATVSAIPPRQGVWRRWNITGITQDWYDGKENYGLAFVPLDYAGTNSSPPVNRRATATFAVSARGERARPVFIVQYRNTVGLVGHHTYTTQSLGRAGTGHVGDFMGQLTLVNPIASNASTVMPFALSMVYNSQWADKPFTYRGPAERGGVENGATQNTRVFERMRFGHGWKPSVLQTVVERELSDSSGETTAFLVHLSATGTEHYFRRDDDYSDHYVDGQRLRIRYYRDEDGLGLRIRRVQQEDPDFAAHDHPTFIMRDDQNNRQIFRSGILSEIRDRNNNQIRLIYSTSRSYRYPACWHPYGNGSSRLYHIRQRNNDGTEIILATFGYNDATNQLTAITDRAGNITRFNHEGNRLSWVAHLSDGTRAQYIYDTQGRIIEVYDRESHRGVLYMWGSRCNQIIGIRSFASTIEGREYTPTFWRNGRMPGATLYRDTGRDGTPFTEDDILEHVVFDHFGRTVNYSITDYTGRNVLAASTSRFTRQTGTDRRTNRVEQASTIGVPAVNLLRNSGFEQVEAGSDPTHWDTRWGRGLSVSTNAAYARTGSHSLQAVDQDSGLRQRVYLRANTTYTLSAYVNTSRASAITNGVMVHFSRPDIEINGIVAASPRLSIITNPAANGGWQRISVTYRTTNDRRAYDMSIAFQGFTGTIHADDFQLEVVHSVTDEEARATANTGPSSANLVQNGGFELAEFIGQMVARGSDEVRSYGRWTQFHAADHPGNSGIWWHPGRRTHVLSIHGHPDRRAFVFQDVPIHLPSSETFVLSGWAQADSLPYSGSNWEPGFGLVARITYADNVVEHHYMRFNSDIQEGTCRHTGDHFDGWQFGSMPIVPRRSGQMVTSIRVMAHYNHNANTARFDNISLVREAAQTFRHDENGNLVGVQQSGLRDMPNSTFDGNNNLLRQVTRGHGTFHYTYDATTNNLTRIISGPTYCDTNHNLMMRITYDNSGNATQSTLTGGNDDQREALGMQLVSNATFSNDRNLVSTTTDANGTIQTNDYGGSAMEHHRMHGIPTLVRDGLGNETATRIDRHTGRPRMTFQRDLVAAHYFYQEGNLSAIRRHGFYNGARIYQTYNFRYNAFGQMTEISLGNFALGTIRFFNPETEEYEGLTSGVGNEHVLKTYEYHPVDHTLTSRTYGNGHRVHYAYDFLRRVTEVSHCDGTRFAYSYTGDGQLYSIHEYAPGATQPRRTYEYTYDTLGRLVTFTERGAPDPDDPDDPDDQNNYRPILQHGSHSYDDAGRLSAFRYYIPGIAPEHQRNTTFQFDEDTGNLTRMGLAAGDDWRLDFTYDNLQRVRSRRLINETDDNRDNDRLVMETLYAYRTRQDMTSTMQVRWMTHQIGNERLPFEYGYDNIGQITWWVDGANEITHAYRYDAQNQLVHETIMRDDPHPQLGHIEETFVYTYDTFGNIRKRQHWDGPSDIVSPRTMTFSYDYDLWPDLLTAV
ncbi:MAG: DNRLRE domain-containing protein, partial [Oscillospiraceae bacterium]|nr:DNRLRE domain-containing protein [Oscillospiraceae bacterium]